MGKAIRLRGECQKNIVKLLDGLCGRYSRWEVWQDCQRWPARHLDTRRWEVQPILCAPVLIGMEVFGVKNGLAVKKRKYTVKYRKTTAP